MEITEKKSILFILLMASGPLFPTYSLNGTVIDKNGIGIEGARVELANAALATTSGNDGTWILSVPSGVRPMVRKKLLPAPAFIGAMLHFVVAGEYEKVTISVYTIGGRFMYHALDSKLAAGFYRLNPLKESFGANI